MTTFTPFVKRPIFLAFLLCIGLSSKGQNWVWAKSLSLGSAKAAIQSDKQGSVYTAFITAAPSTSNISVCGTYPLFAKYDGAGNMLWAQGTLGAAVVMDFAFDAMNNVYVCGSINNGCVFCGGTQSTISVPTGSTTKSFAGKYNSNGDLLWITYWADSTLNVNAEQIVCDSSGNSYISCLGYSNGASLSSLRKINSSGQLIWVKDWLTTNGFNGFVITGMDVDMHSALYISGTFKDTLQIGAQILLANQPQCIICQTAIVAKIDGTGNCLWLKKMAGTYTLTKDLKVDNSGHFYVGGICQYGCSPGGTFMNPNGFVAKYDTSGNAIWLKNQRPSARHLVIDSQDNCIAYGNCLNGKNTFGTIPDTMSLNNWRNNGGEMYVLKYNTLGQPLWAVSASTLTDGFNFGEQITIDPYDNIYTSGIFWGASMFGNNIVSSTYQAGFYEIYFAKTDNFNPNSVGINSVASSEIFSVYPNPVSNKLSITFSTTASAVKKIKILDLLGNLLYDEQHEGENLQIDFSRFNIGVFFVEVSQGGNVNRQKVIKL